MQQPRWPHPGTDSSSSAALEAVHAAWYTVGRGGTDAHRFCGQQRPILVVSGTAILLGIVPEFVRHPPRRPSTLVVRDRAGTVVTMILPADFKQFIRVCTCKVQPLDRDLGAKLNKPRRTIKAAQPAQLKHKHVHRGPEGLPRLQRRRQRPWRPQALLLMRGTSLQVAQQDSDSAGRFLCTSQRRLSRRCRMRFCVPSMTVHSMALGTRQQHERPFAEPRLQPRSQGAAGPPIESPRGSRAARATRRRRLRRRRWQRRQSCGTPARSAATGTSSPLPRLSTASSAR